MVGFFVTDTFVTVTTMGIKIVLFYFIFFAIIYYFYTKYIKL